MQKTLKQLHSTLALEWLSYSCFSLQFQNNKISTFHFSDENSYFGEETFSTTRVFHIPVLRTPYPATRPSLFHLAEILIQQV